MASVQLEVSTGWRQYNESETYEQKKNERGSWDFGEYVDAPPNEKKKPQVYFTKYTADWMDAKRWHQNCSG